MSYVDGFDQYSACRRRAEVTELSAHVLLTVEGSDGHGEIMLTPLQATALGGALEAAAIRIAEACAMSEPSRDGAYTTDVHSKRDNAADEAVRRWWFGPPRS